jgi:alpha-L-fucosidase 2
MLVQSSESEIRLLPALPDAWESGKVKGICARGGFEISMEWENSKLKQVTVYAKKDGTTTLIYGSQKKTIALKGGKKWRWFGNISK